MKSALYGIYALVVFVSEILLVRCAHSFDFWYVNNSRVKILCASSFHEVFYINSLLSLDMVFHWLTICIVDANLLDRIRRLSLDWVVGLVASPFSPTENRNGVVQPTNVRVNTRQWISSHDLLASILFQFTFNTQHAPYIWTPYFTYFRFELKICC